MRIASDLIYFARFKVIPLMLWQLIAEQSFRAVAVASMIVVYTDRQRYNSSLGWVTNSEVDNA